MALLLHIDTALARASVGISADGKLLAEKENTVQNSHAGFVHRSLSEILTIINNSPAAIDAVGVVYGPGSYTGLRIGMATAKGLCYALGKPLICISTLSLLAKAAAEQVTGMDLYYCPMIDARRNEVYTAVYDSTIVPIEAPRALVLNELSFANYLQKKRVLFCGNGAGKFQKIIQPSANARFENVQYNGSDIAQFVYKSFINKEFQDIAYASPLYLKDFFDTRKA